MQGDHTHIKLSVLQERRMQPDILLSKADLSLDLSPQETGSAAQEIEHSPGEYQLPKLFSKVPPILRLLSACCKEQTSLRDRSGMHRPQLSLPKALQHITDPSAHWGAYQRKGGTDMKHTSILSKTYRFTPLYSKWCCMILDLPLLYSKQLYNETPNAISVICIVPTDKIK